MLCFVVELIILVLYGTLWAAAAQVKLCVLRLKFVWHTGAFYQFGLIKFHVIHAATTCAQKVCVWRGVGIKTAVVLINGQLQCGTLSVSNFRVLYTVVFDRVGMEGCSAV